MRIKPCPSFLKTEGRAFWKRVLSTYQFEDVEQFTLLGHAAECLDTMETARVQIEKEPFFVDRFGATKQSPAFKVMYDQKSLFCRLVRELGLTLSDEQTRGKRRY